MKKTIVSIGLAALCLLALTSGKKPEQPVTKHGDPDEKVLIAYVFSPREMPDPTWLTHINYAFGHVNETFDGVLLRDKDAKALKKISRLKRRFPHLKVLLSIGGWGSGRFSEMVSDPQLRMSFARDCKRVVDKYRLDGIDIDWEYPSTSVAKISSAPTDIDNYTLMMRDIRSCIGADKLLTQATCGGARYIDFKGVDPYIDYTNIMSYDLGHAPFHNATLFRSELTDPNSLSVEECLQRHLDAGVSRDKLVLGLPFYGRGAKDFPRRGIDPGKVHLLPGYTYHWDNVAKVPYLTSDETGEMVYGYEDEKSLACKAQFALDQGLKGAMYWSYNSDTAAGDFRRTVYQVLNGIDPRLGMR